MASPEEESLLLALDACCDASATTLDTAVHVAARLDAALEALFVEDTELLRAAELPFSSEVGAGGERGLDPERLRRTNREASQRVERLMSESARVRNVRFRWRVAEGTRLLLAAAQAMQSDLFVPGRPSRRRGAAAPGAVRVAVVHGDPAHTARALVIVRALAGNGHLREILLVGESRPGPELLAALAGYGLRTYVQAVALADPQAALADIAAHAPDLLVAPRELLLPAGTATPARALDALPMSLLLLR